MGTPPSQGTTAGRSRLAGTRPALDRPDCGRMQRWRDVTFPSAASRASACPRSGASRRRPRRSWWRPGSTPIRSRATSSSTSTPGAAGSPVPRWIDSAGRRAWRRARSPGSWPRSSSARPTSAISTRPSRRSRRRPASSRPSRSGWARSSAVAAPPAGGRSSSTRSSGRAARTARRAPSTSTTAVPPAATRSAAATSVTARSTRPTWPRSPRRTRGATPGARSTSASRPWTATTRSSSSSSTSTRPASWPVSRRSSSGSRPISARPRSRRPCAWPSSTPWPRRPG